MGNSLLFLLVTVIWGSTYFAITFQLGEVANEWSLFYRFFFSTIILFTFTALTKRRLKFNLQDHKVFVGLGFLLFSVNYYMVYWGTEYLASGLVAIVFSSITLFNIINAAVFLKRPFEPSILFASTIGIAGITILFLPEIKHFGLSDGSVLGLLITTIAVYSASLGNTLAASKRAKTLPVIPTNTWGMLYGTIFIAAYALYTGKPIGFEMSSNYIISLAYLSIFGTVIAFTAYLVLIARIGPERAGYFAIITPVFALTLSTIFENYHWAIEGVVGITLALSGNYLVLKKKQEIAEKVKA